MFEIALPGIITGDELAEKRDGFTLAGLRYETPGFDLGGLDSDQTTVFLFDDEIEAAKFRMTWG